MPPLPHVCVALSADRRKYSNRDRRTIREREREGKKRNHKNTTRVRIQSETNKRLFSCVAGGGKFEFPNTRQKKMVEKILSKRLGMNFKNFPCH